MALSILDGNQSATTLSTILAGGEHTPAHTVVSLGSTAISNITSAVSGSVVSISNFPATQPISGSISISGTPSVTFSAVTISNLPATQTVAGTVTANLSSSNLNSVTIGVRGVVTASSEYAAEIGFEIAPPQKAVAIGFATDNGQFFSDVTEDRGLPVRIIDYSINLPPIPISGTITASNIQTVTVGAVVSSGTGLYPSIAGYDSTNGTFKLIPLSENGDAVLVGNINGIISSINPLHTTVCGGTVTANVGIASEADVTQFGEWIANGFNAAQPTIAVIGSSAGQPFPISGTVTVGAVPNGSLTTRFGTPTTANTAFATSAVTNANRKYLLIQNVTTGGNVITVGVGFTPTTTQGIQLVAGAGITFESSYIPTGAVYVLSSVTASNFTILES